MAQNHRKYSHLQSVFRFFLPQIAWQERLKPKINFSSKQDLNGFTEENQQNDLKARNSSS